MDIDIGLNTSVVKKIKIFSFFCVAKKKKLQGIDGIRQILKTIFPKSTKGRFILLEIKSILRNSLCKFTMEIRLFVTMNENYLSKWYNKIF